MKVLLYIKLCHVHLNLFAFFGLFVVLKIQLLSLHSFVTL